jgi:hypothetical protein
MKSPYPIRPVHSVNHWKFQRTLPHGKFSVHPRDTENAPWFKIAIIVLIVGYFVLCAFESGVFK